MPPLDDALRAIWERRRPEVLGRVEVIERAVAALLAGELSEQLRGEAHSAAHMLAGSVGTFGYLRASQLARELESELALTDAQFTCAPDASELVLSLRRELEAEVSTTSESSLPETENRPRLAQETTRVLLVDDDPASLEAMSALLGGHELEVFTLTDARRLPETLQEVVPELLVLDLDMPHASGHELCRAVRRDPRWSRLSVIFVTANTDPETVEGLFAAGADDYLAKPLRGTELITRVSNRLQRTRLHRLHAETDSLTGLATRAKASEQLRRLLLLAERFPQPVSIAMIDVDHFKLVNDTQGHAAGDSVLRGLGAQLGREFRGDDIVGRWGGEEFVAGMYGMTREDGVRRLAETLKRFEREQFTGRHGAFQVSFSAGVAQFPLDGGDLDTITSAAFAL